MNSNACTSYHGYLPHQSRILVHPPVPQASHPLGSPLEVEASDAKHVLEVHLALDRSSHAGQGVDALGGTGGGREGEPNEIML